MLNDYWDPILFYQENQKIGKSEFSNSFEKNEVLKILCCVYGVASPTIRENECIYLIRRCFVINPDVFGLTPP